MMSRLALALPFALGLLGCGVEVSVPDARGDLWAGGDAGLPVQPDAGIPAEECVSDLGPIAPAGSCDGSGTCGGISETEGCIHCAMQGACGQFYFAANQD